MVTVQHPWLQQYPDGVPALARVDAYRSIAGVSKGATLSHGNVVANIMQCEAWFKPMVERVGDH